MVLVPLPNSNDKKILRKEIMNRRQVLSAGEVQHRSQNIFNSFIKNSAVLLPKDFHSIALYFPIKGEVDTRPFFKYFSSRKRICLFPRIQDEANNKSLHFYAVKDFSELQLSKWGIAEPKPVPGIQPIIPDLVLVPGVVFSADSHRVGFGGGYYDRTAAEWHKSGARQNIRLIGLAYDFQIVAKISHEPHDQVLDFVVAESQIFKKGTI